MRINDKNIFAFHIRTTRLGHWWVLDIWIMIFKNHRNEIYFKKLVFMANRNRCWFGRRSYWCHWRRIERIDTRYCLIVSKKDLNDFILFHQFWFWFEIGGLFGGLRGALTGVAEGMGRGFSKVAVIKWTLNQLWKRFEFEFWFSSLSVWYRVLSWNLEASTQFRKIIQIHVSCEMEWEYFNYDFFLNLINCKVIFPLFSLSK